MSRSYEYNLKGRRITVETALVQNDCIYITTQKSDAALYGAWIANADVPTVAAELLKAGGFQAHAELIEDAVEKKLAERRDALMGELFAGLEYTEADDHAQGAVDHIIELEARLEAAK